MVIFYRKTLSPITSSKKKKFNKNPALNSNNIYNYN